MEIRTFPTKTGTRQNLSFLLPGTEQRVDLIWSPGDSSSAGILARLNDVFPRDWTGKEIVATAPGLVTPTVLRAFTTDVEVFVQVFLRQEYDVPLAFEPRFIVDGGANIGLTSLFFAAKYPSAAILAVEAERSNHELLRKNTHGCPTITARHAAIWDRTTTLGVYGLRAAHPARNYNMWGFMVAEDSDASFASSVREQAEKIDEVEGVTIGDLVAASGRGQIDILKLDIEGAEKEVFASEGCRDWLGSVRAIMIEAHDSQKEGCSKAFYEAIAGRRYRESKRGDVTIVEFDQ